MDDMSDTAERLCALIGMIMEDMSVTALLPAEGETLATRLAALDQAGRDIVSLAEASAVITRRWPADR